ncbi:MAG: hypothetical protein NT029_04925 [Armatimonadetes bacterium]|nr:hypothetical protein [Armatimonadota bacterium]
MGKPEGMTRREMMTAAAVTGLAAGLPAVAGAQEQKPALKGRIKQSVSRWCYGGMSLDELCVAAKGMGLVGIDLLG